MKKLIKLIFAFVFISNSAFTEDLSVAWETKASFKLPESVIYDKKNDLLYVSNIANHPFKKDGSGFISKVNMQGEIVELEWIKKLNAPKGLTIVPSKNPDESDKLFIADVDELVEVDIDTAKIVKKYKASGSVCMNDVTHDKYGNVYVGDTYTDSIYRLNSFGQIPLWFYSPGLAPNGIHIDNETGKMIVGFWGAVMEGWGTPELSGSLKSIDLNTKQLKDLGKKPIGNLDGIESDGKGSYYVTDWSKTELYKIKKSGSAKMIKKLGEDGKGAADHEVVLDKNLMIIPIMVENKLVALNIN